MSLSRTHTLQPGLFL